MIKIIIDHRSEFRMFIINDCDGKLNVTGGMIFFFFRNFLKLSRDAKDTRLGLSTTVIFI